MTLENTTAENTVLPQSSTPYLSTKVSVYSSIFYDKTPKQMPLRDVLSKITDKAQKAKFERLRSLDKKAYDSEKTKLKAFTVSATFAGGHSMKNLESYTGLMQLDFDNLSDNDVIRAKKILRKLPFVLAVFDTVKGRNGIKAIAVLNNSDATKHTRYYKDLAKYFLDNHTLVLDKQCCDYTRCFFIPYSEFSHTKDTVTPYSLKYREIEKVVKKPKKQPSSTKNTYQKGKYIFINEFSSNSDKLDKIASFHMRYEPFTDGNRHRHATKFALFAHKMDVPLIDAENYYYANYDKKRCNAFTFEYENRIQNKGTYEYPTYKEYTKPQQAQKTAIKPIINVLGTHKISKYIFEKIDVLRKMINAKGKSFMLDAPTGTGKTDTAMYLINEARKADQSKRFVFFVPTNALAEKMANEYSEASKNYHNLSLKILKLDQYTEVEEKINIAYSIDSYDVVVCVANSYKFIENSITENTVIFYDEIHKCITQHNIAPLQDIQRIIYNNCTKVFMSGTAFSSFTNEFKLGITKFERTENRNTKIHCIELLNEKDIEKGFNHNTAFNSYENAIMNYAEMLEAENKVHLIFLNHKLRQERIKETILAGGKFDVYIVNSENKDNVAYQCLVNNKPIPIKNNKSAIILCTSFVYEGVNLINKSEEISKIAIFGEKYIANVMQALARARKAQDIDVYYFLTKNSNKGYARTFKNFKAEVASTTEKYRSILLESERLKKLLSETEITIKKLTSVDDQYSIIDTENLGVLKRVLFEQKRILLANDVSKLVTSDGKINRIKVVAEYEKKKANEETNFQKFNEIKKTHSNLTIYRKQASDIMSLFIDGNENETLTKELSQIAVKNGERISKVIEDEKQAKKDIKHFVKQILTDNAMFTIALFRDKDIKFRRKAELRTFVFETINKYNYNVLESNEYKEFKIKHKIDLNDYNLFKLISDIVKRLKRIQTHFSFNEKFLKGKQLKAIMLLSKNQFKSHMERLDTMRSIQSDTPNIKELINISMYEKIYETVKTKYEIEAINDLQRNYNSRSELINAIHIYKKNNDNTLSENVYKQLMNVLGSKKNIAETRKDIASILKGNEIVLDQIYTKYELVQLCKNIYEYEVKGAKNQVQRKAYFEAINLSDKQHLDTMKTLFIWKEKRQHQFCEKAGKNIFKRFIVLVRKNSYLEVLNDYADFG
ncbi:MAG: DEAD/DEAH box helicase family protein [Flavobacteriaceae bacterium]